MAKTVWCKAPQIFPCSTSHYGHWNKLSSYYLSERVDDFVLGHISTDAAHCLFQHDQQFIL